MQVECLTGMGDIDPASWNALIPDDNPFLSHAFLLALEESGSVTKATGWLPRHLLLRNEQGVVVAGMPLYSKTHSYGEFVFDWAWADAYARSGLNYYPKLLCAVPFSPVRGARLLGEHPTQLLSAAKALAEESAYSSLHVLFPNARDLATAKEKQFLLRCDCQFHWKDTGYGDFNGFLAEFRSERRRKIRRERTHVREAGFDFQWVTGHDLDSELLSTVYELYAITYRIRGRLPYLDRKFFELITELIPGNIRVLLVRLSGEVVACALYLQSKDKLYGRYWGSKKHYPLLHFETCYYQGIEYCLANDLQHFDPGTQGEHKLLRGFRPQKVYSMHWMRDPTLAAAIADYLQRERNLVNNYIKQCRQCLPFRQIEDSKRS